MKLEHGGGVGTFGSGTYAKQHEMGGCFWQKRKSAFGTFRDQNLVFLGLGDIRLLGQKTTRTKDYPDIRPPGHITTMSNTKRQYVTSNRRPQRTSTWPMHAPIANRC